MLNKIKIKKLIQSWYKIIANKMFYSIEILNQVVEYKNKNKKMKVLNMKHMLTIAYVKQGQLFDGLAKSLTTGVGNPTTRLGRFTAALEESNHQILSIVERNHFVDMGRNQRGCHHLVVKHRYALCAFRIVSCFMCI